MMNTVEEMRSADSRILLFAENDGTTAFFLRNGRIAEVWKERENTARVGDIYLGKIKYYAENIDAYYVEILKGISCFLPADNRKSSGKLHEGDEVLVQIKKEAYKTKLAFAATRLDIAGRYSVITNDAPNLYYSKKLEHDTRDRLQQLIDEQYPAAERKFQILIRTAAGECREPALILKEIKENATILQQIISASAHTYPLCKMHGSASIPELLFLERKVMPDTKIITKERSIYERVNGLCWQYGYDPKEMSVLYSDPQLPLSVLYGLKNRLREITEEKIWLPSGGSLYIAPTEALTVIDVNTGKYSSKNNREETFLKINLEASREIASQIQARNLSGIILVDFINMQLEKNATILLLDLKNRLKECTPPGTVVDITKLGLIEITREKKRSDIYEIQKELYKTILL